MKILELGCGSNKYPGAIGMDVNPNSQADLIHDLNDFPYPCETDEFDEIIATSVIEHLDNVVRVMEEIHRIGKPDALVKIIVPHFSSWNGFTDPTHRHQFSSRSFDYFVKDRDAAKYRYSQCFFEIVNVTFHTRSGGIFKYFDRFITFLANKFKDQYERRFAFIFPTEEIVFILKVKK